MHFSSHQFLLDMIILIILGEGYNVMELLFKQISPIHEDWKKESAVYLRHCQRIQLEGYFRHCS
jgi:hypothetical protein